MMDALRTGLWLTRDRFKRFAALFLVIQGLALGSLWATSNGRVDRLDRPIGTDFSQIWVAGVFTLEGRPEKPFDNAAHEARQKEFFTPTSGFFAWGYPPIFLAAAAVFALFPYWLALVLWQGTTLPLYLAAVWRVTPRSAASGGEILLAAAAFPAVFVNIGHGHNGFLTAGLLAGGLLLVERRPWLAGACFGLLAYKPQFGLLIPFALMAGGYWRTAAAAAATVAALFAATVAAWGLEPWRLFLSMSDWSRAVLLEQGATGFEKIQSVFSAVRFNGGSIGLAYALHGVFALTALACVVATWRSRADLRLKSAQLMTGALLATPYCLDYDMMILGPAVAFSAAHGMEKGFRPWEKSLLAFVYLTPVVTRSIASVTGVHLGLVAAWAFFAFVTWRALSEQGERAPGVVGRTPPSLHDGAEASAKPLATRQLGGFALVGGIGFLVDVAVTAGLALLGAGPILARAPAILAALTTTFGLNRIFVFPASGAGVVRDFARYAAVSAGGAALNAAAYLVVSAALSRSGVGPAAAATIGVAAGSVVAMGANFMGYRGLVFRAAR
jgi:putative flippase GtrA